ncbi:MAG: hypothetical protein QQN63_08800 [Nitrosopumilus sp.]
MFVLGIAGALGSGKSTLARMIITSFSNSTIMPFAYPLKKFAVDLGWDGKKNNKGRRLLQLIGTDCGRECIDEDIWINKWEVFRSEAKTNGKELFIGDDMRFKNEIDHILMLRGVTIKMVGRDSYTSEAQKNHPSEKGLDNKDFDFVFDNAGTIDDMQVFAKTVVDYLNV